MRIRVALIPIALVAAACTTVGASAPAGADDGLDPLELGISIHVEGYDDRDPTIYARHLAQIQEVANEASAAGGVLTFELDRKFTDGAIAAGDTFVATLDDLGQSVGVHADLGGTPLDPAEFVSRLQDHKADVESLLDPGDVVTSVSGVCSEQDWVEPVIAASFDVATGSVEFCLKSLDEIPAEYDAAAVEACASPQDCHGQAPTDMEHKLHPWRTSDSATWLTDDPDGELWILAGESGTAVHCLAEGGSGRCRATNADIPRFADLVQTYVDAREDGRFNALNLSWSIGGPVGAGFTTALVESVQPLVDAGDVVWKGLGAIAAGAEAFAGDAAATEGEPAEEHLVAWRAGATAGEYWVTNPATGMEIWTRVVTPSTGTGPFPVVVMVPGGRGTSTLFTGRGNDAQRLADLGYLVVVFDPEGRGNSRVGRVEDDGGADHQAGLAEIARFAAGVDGADASRIAFATNSYGVTMAAGALATDDDLGVDVLVDWEGPADRTDTADCDGDGVGGHLDAHSCEGEDEFWAEREAITFIGSLGDTHYVRLQSETDHVQADTESARRMVNEALGGTAEVWLNTTPVTSALTDLTGLLLPDVPWDRQFPALVDQALARWF